MSAVALNVCKNYPGQLATLTEHSHKHTHAHTKHPQAAVTIHNTPDDLLGPPSSVLAARLSAHTHAEGRREKGRGSRLTSPSISVFLPLLKKSKILSKVFQCHSDIFRQER